MKTEHQEWVSKRVEKVNSEADLYSILTEFGFEIPERGGDYQIQCPFHGADNRPSARYYCKKGKKAAHFRCFKCKITLEVVGFTAKTSNISFMEALSRLERKYGIIVSKALSFSLPEELNEKTSSKWYEVPSLLEALESKLSRLRYKASMNDYVSFCHALDSVRIEYDRLGEQNEGMLIKLNEVRKRMDDVYSFDHFMLGFYESSQSEKTDS